MVMDLNKPPEEDEASILIMLLKDGKPISQVSCPNSPVKIPEALHIKDITPAAYHPLTSLPQVYFHSAGQNRFQHDEWLKFLSYLLNRDKVAICQHGNYEFLITPPVGREPAYWDRVPVAYRFKELPKDGEVLDFPASAGNRIRESVPAGGDNRPKPPLPALHTKRSQVVVKSEDSRRPRVITEDACLGPQNSQALFPRPVSGDVTCTSSRDYQDDGLHPVKQQALYQTLYSLPRLPVNLKQNITSVQMEHQTPLHSSREVKQEKSSTDRVKPRYGVNPEYLNTLRHSHNEWAFGALAELIDNSRDANASRLDISIQMEFHKRAGQKIPVLSVIDNGCGMSHLDIVRMVSLGHARPAEDNRDHIGRFGVGFKTGSMQLGKDVVVLTQSKETRSIAFLSRSYNENKQEVDIPIITYRNEGGWMDFDLEAHSTDEAEAQLKVIKEYSPFNEYTIGSKFASFGENGTGTQIYIYNLARWGSDYSLAWDEKSDEERNSKKKRDIWIRSRRVRTRQGQISQEVPLDYSLHAYLEVIFLNPRMKIYVQGTMVGIRPLAKSLNNTKVIKDVLVGKNVELTLGRSQEEKERGNCGIFLYWHGRLIEAYKRVGGMVQSADMGRGVIGVMDVTDIMKDGNEVMVLNTKQRFQDCEAFAILEQWLGCKADEYWDENFDTLELRDNSKGYKPDYQWVQCNKCRKWRILDPSFRADNLPAEWFCFMPPFKGLCDIPEQKVEPGVITVSAKRSSGSFTNTRQLRPVKEEVNVTLLDDSVVTTTSNKGESDTSTESEETIPPVTKYNLKRRLPPPQTNIQKKQGESEISTDSEDELVVELPVAKRPLKRLRRGPPPLQGGIAKRSRGGN